MNVEMLRTELYKIFLKKIIWVSLMVFLGMFFVLKLQFIEKPGIKYTLEPMRPELTDAVRNEEFHEFVRNANYSCTADEIKKFIPQSVYDYIKNYKDNERIYHSLNSDLVSIINNYFERIDNRTEYISALAEDTENNNSDLARAKEKILRDYKNADVEIDLNLERSANNFIDVNHSTVFPGLIMLVIIVGLAGIYSDEYTCGTQAALLTSQKGRKYASVKYKIFTQKGVKYAQRTA